jgi:hypothetical protein
LKRWELKGAQTFYESTILAYECTSAHAKIAIFTTFTNIAKTSNRIEGKRRVKAEEEGSPNRIL